MNRARSMLVRLLLVVNFLFLLMVAGCPEPFGNFDNPYDEKSPDYQGYPAVDDPADIKPVTSDAEGLLFVPRLTVLTIAGADSYEFQVSADPAFSDPGFILVSARNISPLEGWPALQAGTTYYWRARAHEGASWGPWTSTQAAFSLAVPSFTGTVPQGGQTITDTTPSFDWADLAGAVSYRFQLASDGSFADILDEAGPLLGSLYTPAKVLSNDALYHWRLGAVNADGLWTAWSAASSFTISWNPQITGMSPANGETTNDTMPTLEWDDADGAVGYELRIAATVSGLVMAEAILVEGSSYSITSAIPNGELRSWNLVPLNVDGVRGAVCGPWTFSVDLDKPALLYPSDAASTTDTSPAFGWTTVAGASAYRLQLAGSESFDDGSILFDRQDLVLPGLLPDGFELTQTIPEGYWYYWRVAASVGGVWSSWTAVRSVFIGIPVPILQSPLDGSILIDTTPVFDWTSVLAADRYRFQLSTTDDFAPGSLIADSEVFTSAYTQATNLSQLSTYYWRVSAGDADGYWSDWTPSQSFTYAIPVPSIPDLSADDDSGLSDSDNITKISSGLSFSGSGAVEGFTVVLFSDFDGELGRTTAGAGGLWSIEVDLSVDPVFHVRTHVIRARIASGAILSDPSDSLTVSIDTRPPNALVFLKTPVQGAYTETDLSPRFSWTQSPVAVDGYWLQVDDNPDFSSPEINLMLAGTDTTHWDPPADLAISTGIPVGKRYWVRVRAIDTAGNPCTDTVGAPRYVDVGRFRNDFNGDGYSDLVAGAYGYDAPGADWAGRIYIFYGGAAMDAVPDLVITGNTAGQALGQSYSGGDFNGDGYCDLATNRGYIFFGSQNPDGTSDLQLTAPSGDINVVAFIGDANGDGYEDLACQHNNNVSVYLGGQVPSSLAAKTIVNGAFNFGGCIDSAGDLNLDGYSDLIIGNSDFDYTDLFNTTYSDVGSVSIYYGGQTIDDMSDVSIIGSSNTGKLFFGHGIASGDLNDDGVPDIAVGVPYASGGSYNGKVLVYYGPVSGSSFDTTADFTYSYTTAGEEMGASVAIADINGDGKDDLLIGSPAYNNWTGCFTKLFGPLGSVAPLATNGIRSKSSFGSRLQVVGDCNADGFEDFAIGANLDSVVGSNAGAIYLYLGSEGTGSPQPSWFIEFLGENAGDYLGYIEYAVGA